MATLTKIFLFFTLFQTPQAEAIEPVSFSFFGTCAAVGAVGGAVSQFLVEEEDEMEAAVGTGIVLGLGRTSLALSLDVGMGGAAVLNPVALAFAGCAGAGVAGAATASTVVKGAKNFYAKLTAEPERSNHSANEVDCEESPQSIYCD